MRSKTALGLFLAGTFSAGAALADPPPRSDAVVHEWGTFLAMSGSDGVSLDGMYHEEHALPGFVHARGRDQLRPLYILSKGETPVIYFYTNTPQSVRVEVKFPSGSWTQWYPQAAGLFPHLTDALPVPTPVEPPKSGSIIWHAQIVPATKAGPLPPPPSTSADALWNFARQVDSAYVQTYNVAKAAPNNVETERFLFYRGLGTAPLPLKMTAESGGTLAMDEGSTSVSHLFVIRVEGGKGAYAYIPSLRPGEAAREAIPSMADALPVDRFADRLADDLAARLVQAGLFPKEARAMVNTWKSSYFRAEGVRTLFVLPQSWTDAFIPMTINPAPKETVRVMVGRLEMLTPSRERLAERAVLDLGSPNEARRLAGFEYLRGQGRYVEPIVRRVVKATKDENVRLLGRRLLLTGLATDLRSAVNAVEGKPLPPMTALSEDPTMIRARLASLLRELGLDAEAKVEGNAAMKLLGARPEPEGKNCYDRIDMKARALALEGRGDDRGAARQYGRLVDLAGLALRSQECRQCHQKAGGPVDLAGMTDWWAGEKFAQATEKAGGRDSAIAAEEARLASGKDEAKLRLKFLKAAR